jgi:glycosyltransferase involved in cell wall biosynthesis
MSELKLYGPGTPRRPVDGPAAGGEPTFSVIIPTYNRADLVCHAVDSVARQTFTDHEIIVVDDGSTDGTREALEPWIHTIRYIRQENRGAAAARNRGIEESRGRFLAFLDSDDRFEPRMLEAALDTFERHPRAGSVSTAERELDHRDQPGKRVYTKRSPGVYFSSAGLVDRDTRIGAGRPAVVRREWVERLGGFDETIRCAIDCELWIRYSFHTQMVLQPEPLVLRRIHPTSLSCNRKQDALDWIHILERLVEEQPQFVREHRRVWRRSLGKQYLRYGRELLNQGGWNPELLQKARHALRKASLLAPRRMRGPLYLAWSFVAPASYPRWRRLELTYFSARGGRPVPSGQPRLGEERSGVSE